MSHLKKLQSLFEERSQYSHQYSTNIGNMEILLNQNGLIFFYQAMENQIRTRIAFDLGGVIIIRGALTNQIHPESYVSVKLAVQKFGKDNVFIISKAKQKYIQRNIDLLKQSDIEAKTGFNMKNLYFVDEFIQKGDLGKKLGIHYILDDSVKVAKIALDSGFQPILFGAHEELMEIQKKFMYAKNWKHFRKLICKIKQYQ